MTTSEDGHWSEESLPLQEAVAKAPVLVKLEDGFRGCLESLSFSLGDVLALEGDISARGRRLVLAHYTTEMEKEEGGPDTGDQALYRSLLTIPWEHLPQVDVRVCRDPGGLQYSNFVSKHFPQHNWRGQQQELLDTLDEDDYDQIQEIIPNPRQTSSCPQASSGGRPPPPLPPRSDPSSPPPIGNRPLPLPPRPLPVQQGEQVARAAVIPRAASLQPPPRPPKLGKGGSVSGTGKTEALFPSELSQEPPASLRPDSQVSNDGCYLELIDGVSDEEYTDMKELTQALARSPRQGKLHSPQTEEKKPCSKSKEEKRKPYPASPKEQHKAKQKAKTAAVKPTVRVQPVMSKQASSAALRPPIQPPAKHSDTDDDSDDPCYDEPLDVGTPLSKMTCGQLCYRMEQCGLSTLAKACHDNRLDGAFFCKLSVEDLKKPPFSLTDFEINLKLEQVKMGWSPKI